jgi:hypothetical protein
LFCPRTKTTQIGYILFCRAAKDFGIGHQTQLKLTVCCSAAREFLEFVTQIDCSATRTRLSFPTTIGVRVLHPIARNLDGTG